MGHSLARNREYVVACDESAGLSPGCVDQLVRASSQHAKV